MYRCIVADPPWKYGDKLRMSDVKRSAEDVYKTVMTTDDICKLATFDCDNVPAYHSWQCVMGQAIADDAVLWLWVTDPFLLNGDGMRVCKAWGFEPKQLWTWVKGRVVDDNIVGPLGMGHYMRVDTERVILAGRGKAASLVQQHNLRNYSIVAPKGKHSAKPEEFYALAEALTPGPRLELFSRKRRAGWDVVGDEID
jgi:N6-adenosine-specific RNA methylase IME4